MIDTEPHATSNAQTHASASFFIGRENLRLPSRLLLDPGPGSPVQPVTNMFEVLQEIWGLNGYETGKVAREDTLSLPLTDVGDNLVLTSHYRGLTDNELPDANIKLHGVQGSRPCLWRDTMLQGVEQFAITLAQKRDEASLSLGRASIIAARSYGYKVQAAGSSKQIGGGASQLREVAARKEPSKPVFEPDPECQATYIFLGPRRIYPDLSITGDLSNRVFDGLQLPEEMNGIVSKLRPVDNYQEWLARYVVTELLSAA